MNNFNNDNFSVDFRKETPDVLYFNATIVNQSEDKLKVAQFKQSRPYNILKKSNEYYMAIIRFNIPSKNIAIFNFDEKEYSVSIRNGATTSTQILQYVNQGNPFADISQSDFRGIFYFQQMLDSVNNAFNLAHIGAGVSNLINPPRIIQEADGKFSLLVDTRYTLEEIYMNTELYDLFLSLNANFIQYTGDLCYQLIYRDYFNNIESYPASFTLGGDYYKMTQENKSLFNWNNIAEIVITSSILPAQQEIRGQADVIESQQDQIISNFYPFEQEFTNHDRSNWLYDSGSGYRLIDLLSGDPLRQIDLNVVIISKLGRRFNLQLAPKERIDIKIMFIKKGLANNAYTQVYS